MGGRMNHTKEPWKADLKVGCFAIYPNGQDRNCLEGASDDVIVYQNGRGDKSSPDGYRYLTAEQEANAKRIVACVNACAGITNEALEAGVVHSALINFEESLDLEKGEQFCFYDVPVLEDV
jgi:hypothetical protein